MSETVSETAIIGGSGFYQICRDQEPFSRLIETPYSSEPIELFQETVEGAAVWFLPRHGRQHSIPPHRINYRANLWALKKAGVRSIIAVNAVGGLQAGYAPGTLVIPHQLIDYTWGREHSYHDGLSSLHNHIDFTFPYTAHLREQLKDSCRHCGYPAIFYAVYACTQGPRLETSAETSRLKRDGCDIVGMTAMPEAALARELGLDYASICLVVNWAAGLTEQEISTEQIHKNLDEGVHRIRKLLLQFIRSSG